MASPEMPGNWLRVLQVELTSCSKGTKLLHAYAVQQEAPGQKTLRSPTLCVRLCTGVLRIFLIPPLSYAAAAFSCGYYEKLLGCGKLATSYPIFPIYTTLPQETNDHRVPRRFAAKCNGHAVSSHWLYILRLVPLLVDPSVRFWYDSPSDRDGPLPYGLRGEDMDFYALLDQVVDLLRSRGRVSYRALQRHFGLEVCLPGGAGHDSPGLGAGPAGTERGRAHADMPGPGRPPCHRVRDRGVSWPAGRGLWQGGADRGRAAGGRGGTRCRPRKRRVVSSQE